jgi:co-chaperonin GroES (HSP10)
MQSVGNLKLQIGFVLIEPDEIGSTAGGAIYHREDEVFPGSGTARAVGEADTSPMATSWLMPMVGDRVHFQKIHRDRIKVSGVEFIIMHSSEILATELGE